MKKTILFLILASLSSAVFAGGCEKPKNAFDQVYCAGNQFDRVDRELNQAYGGLRKLLTPAQQETLKQGQLAWMRQRDTECSEEKASGYFVNLDCAVSTTAARRDFLRERSRECMGKGCKEDMLSK